MDVLPTFLALAGTTHPGTSYRGIEIEPVKGKSMLPLISGEATEIYTEDDYMGWELFGQRGVRQGDWKIVWDITQGDDAHWMLFNLTNDISEQNDLSIERPDKLTEMISLWERYEEDNGIIYVYPE